MLQLLRVLLPLLLRRSRRRRALISLQSRAQALERRRREVGRIAEDVEVDNWMGHILERGEHVARDEALAVARRAHTSSASASSALYATCQNNIWEIGFFY